MTTKFERFLNALFGPLARQIDAMPPAAARSFFALL